MPRNKNVFPALFFVIIVMMICCLGCGDSVHAELCRVACAGTNGEFVETETEWPTPTKQKHFCVCRYEIPTIRIQDKPSAKEDTTAKPDKPSVGGTMVQR